MSTGVGRRIETGLGDIPAPQKQKSRYHSVMGPKLKDLVACLDGANDPYDAMSELEQSRGAHVEMMRIFEETQAYIETLPTQTEQQRMLKKEARILAVGMLNDSLQNVYSAMERCARITSMVCDKLHPQYIAGLTRQITEMIYLCFDNGQPEMQPYIDKFEKMLDERLQLPTVKGECSNVQTVAYSEEAMAAMDLSVPGPPVVYENVDGAAL